MGSRRSLHDKGVLGTRASRSVAARVRSALGCSHSSTNYFPDAETGSRERIVARIESYLQALSNTQGMVNATVTHRGCPVASACPLTEMQRERLPFTIKRVVAESARATNSSHADIAGDDFFAQSFWFDACLVAFFDGPYSVDFVRHRARLVTREVSNLLPLLDDPDHDPASTAPIPE